MLVLIEHLPDDSALSAALRGGPQFRGWGADRYLRIAQIEAIRALTWTVARAQTKQAPPKPKPLPLPQKKAPVRVLNLRAIAAAQQRNRPGGGEA